MSAQLKDPSKLTATLKKDDVHSVEKCSEPSVPDGKIPQEKLKADENKQSNQANQTERRRSSTTSGKQESGGFFSFIESKVQPDAAKTAESASVKMLGLSSSIFGSASTLITSAVKDQLNTTPPVSPKMSPSKEKKSPASPKVDQGRMSKQERQPEDQPKTNENKPSTSQEPDQKKKAGPSLQTKTLPLAQDKVDISQSQLLKPEVDSQESIKPDQATCPLCKIKLNINSKDPPNYDNCTQCKSRVCNQCGFNLMPNNTGVRE